MKLFGSSGIRAVFSRDLLDLAFRVGLVIGARYPRSIVGKDTRTSGDAMKSAVCAGILAAGGRCVDAGITPTPTLAYITREYDAGVMLTASHNPPEYNGIKLLNPDGSSFGLSQQEELERVLEHDTVHVGSWDTLHPAESRDDAVARHIERIAAAMPRLDGVKVVVDAGGGAASEVTPGLLARLGCEVVPLYCRHSGVFPRGGEPVEANLGDLMDTVKKTGAALGIAHDGDADRMMVVDERGRFLSGDTLLALFVKGERAGDVVTTLDASMAVDEMGAAVRRTRIGDTWVSEELRKGGDFGGETSGCWIFPAISLCPDGIYAAARIAALAAGEKISALADALPSYPLRRGSIAGTVPASLEAALRELGPDSVDTLDGIKLNFSDGWVLVRPSGTEPKIRLSAEAKTAARADELYSAALSAVTKTAITGGISS